MAAARPTDIARPTSMRFDRSGVPFVLGSLVPAALLALVRRPRLAAPFALAGGFLLFFFRDPDRDVPDDRGAVLAPADGRVMVAGPGGEDGPPGRWLQISIFLSPLDVHVNRMPLSGTVTDVRYRPGRFLPAYRSEAGSDNERTEIWIEHDGRPVVVRQVVGILARRIVCRTAPGAEVQAGERFGIMKFGSRMDVFLPPDATLLVQAGDRVRAGESIVARLDG